MGHEMKEKQQLHPSVTQQFVHSASYCYNVSGVGVRLLTGMVSGDRGRRKESRNQTQRRKKREKAEIGAEMVQSYRRKSLTASTLWLSKA